MTPTDAASTVALIAAGATGAGYLARKTWSGVRTVVHTIDLIEHEFHPNEGGSLRDAVNRIETVVTDLNTRVERLERAP